MLQCHEDGQQLIVLDRIHANVIFLVGSLLYMPVSIWDVIVERRKQQDMAVEAENAYFMDDDASSTLQLQAQQQEHWLYLFTLLLATLAYLLNGLLETKMSIDDYQREMERLLQLPPSSTSQQPLQHELHELHELPLPQQKKHEALPVPPTLTSSPPPSSWISPSTLLQDDSHGQLDKRVLLLPDLHCFHPQLHSPLVEISPRFKHDIINGGLFCIAAALEFAFSIVGRSKILLSLSAHCYVANALLTIWLRRRQQQQDNDNVHSTRFDPSILLVHAGDWLFLVGATLDATGTWLELLGYLKEPAGLWLLSSVAWLTDSLLYLAADVMNLQQEEEEKATRQQQQQEDEEYNNRIVSDNDDDDNVCDTKKAYPPTFPHYHIVHESTKELVEFRSDRRANRADQSDDTANNYQLQEDNSNDDETRNVAKVLARVNNNNNNNNNNIIIKTPPLPALMDRTDFDSGSLVTPYVAADGVNFV